MKEVPNKTCRYVASLDYFCWMFIWNWLLLQVIEELPAQESPEIFGLHPNADLTFRTLQVQSGVQIIMDTQPKGGGGGTGLSREEVVDHICEDLLSKVRFLVNSIRSSS